MDFFAIPSAHGDLHAIIPQHSAAAFLLDGFAQHLGLPRLREDAAVLDREEFEEFLDLTYAEGFTVDQEEREDDSADRLIAPTALPF